MVDPPRPESMQAVADAKMAGIRPIMITGDHKITAVAIAKQIGIFEEGDMAVTGMELDAMSEEELDKNIANISVYARVSPENKIRIVESWQRCGNIVSMTGDGVNDAPALKKADIGVAMGITGTEVSKDAAAMILSDDNFATIIKAVANGRNVYRNIKNAILFLLSGNMAGILSVLCTSLAGLPVPFAPVHLLFMNLLADSLPAIALGLENPDKNIMSEKPRDIRKSIFADGLWGRILIEGTMIGILNLLAFSIGRTYSLEVGRTMAFVSLGLLELVHSFNIRTEESIFKGGLFKNKYLILAFIGGAILQTIVVVIPGLAEVFKLTNLTARQWLYTIGISLLPVVIMEVQKLSNEFKFGKVVTIRDVKLS